MVKKQYINSSNRSPSMLLVLPWLLALTTYTLKWPEWVYGISITLAVLLAITYFYRLATEEGVDVVKRD